MSKHERSARMSDKMRNLVSSLGDDDSYKPIITKSVENNLNTIPRFCNGHEHYNELIHRFNNDLQRYVEEELPSAPLDVKLGSKTQPTAYDISEEDEHTVARIQEVSNVSKADVIRACVILEVSRRSRLSDSDDPKDKKYMMRASDVKACFVAVEGRFMEILRRRFTVQMNMDDSFGKILESEGLEEFGYYWVNEFIGTDAYHRLREEYNEEIINNVEDAIDEYTDYNPYQVA